MKLLSLRNVFFLFAIYLVFEGALRKWVLPQFSTPLFLLKDILMILIFVLLTNRRHPQKIWVPPEVSGLVFLVSILFTAVFLVNYNGLVSFIGLRYYLVILPLIFVIPVVFNDTEDLERAAYYYLILTAVICLIGIFQYYSPVDSFINRYSWSRQEMKIATIVDPSGTSRARITGTFSYITPYSIFIQSMFFIGLAVLLTTQNSLVRKVTTAILVLIFVNILFTGSRGALLMVSFLAIPFSSRLRARTVISATLVLSASIYMFGNEISVLLDTVTLRNEKAGDSVARLYGVLMTPFNTILASGIVGTGIGTTFLGMAELNVTPKLPSSGFNEVLQDRVGLETGAIVYLGLLAIRLLVITRTAKLYTLLRSHNLKVWCLVSLVLQVSWIWQIPFYQTVGMVFYCFSIGLYLLLELNRRQLPRKTFKTP